MLWTFHLKDGYVSPPYDGRDVPNINYRVVNDDFGNVVYVGIDTNQILCIVEHEEH